LRTTHLVDNFEPALNEDVMIDKKHPLQKKILYLFQQHPPTRYVIDWY